MMDVYLEPWRFPAEFHQDEDVSSLAVRMAAKGGMTVEQFVRLYLRGGEYGANDVAFDKAMTSRLATIAGIDQVTLLANSLSDGRAKYRSVHVPKGCFRGLNISPDFLATRKRVAPGMLAFDKASPYLRLAWRFMFLPGDPNTGEVLIDRCQNCLKILSWSLPNLCLCGHCGYDVRAVEPMYLDDGDRQATLLLADAFGLLDGRHPRPLDLPEPFRERDLHQQIEALVWLAGFRGRIDGTHLTAKATNAYKALQWAKDWELVLRDIVMLIFRQTEGMHRDILADLTLHLNSMPISDLRHRLIEQVQLIANGADVIHPDLKHLKRAPYTTFPRGARYRPDQPKKRSSHRAKRSSPERSSR